MGESAQPRERYTTIRWRLHRRRGAQMPLAVSNGAGVGGGGGGWSKRERPADVEGRDVNVGRPPTQRA